MTDKSIVFEDDLADKQVVAVEKTIQHEEDDIIGEPGIELGHIDGTAAKKE